MLLLLSVFAPAGAGIDDGWDNLNLHLAMSDIKD